jgi:hypothetical protein
MAGDRDDFLRRWSRRKRGAGASAPKPAPASDAPALPPLDSLTFESDFRAFMHAKVEEGVKRAALKKLFSDPRFNVIDQMDIDIDDYSKLEVIPQEMLEKLEHARATLFGPQARNTEEEKPQAEESQVTQAPEAQEKKADDGAAG